MPFLYLFNDWDECLMSREIGEQEKQRLIEALNGHRRWERIEAETGIMYKIEFNEHKYTVPVKDFNDQKLLGYEEEIPRFYLLIEP